MVLLSGSFMNVVIISREYRLLSFQGIEYSTSQRRPRDRTLVMKPFYSPLVGIPLIFGINFFVIDVFRFHFSNKDSRSIGNYDIITILDLLLESEYAPNGLSQRTTRCV